MRWRWPAGAPAVYHARRDVPGAQELARAMVLSPALLVGGHLLIAEWREGMRSLLVLASLILVSTILGSNAFGQTCLRPEWGKCVSFPNGGSHSGVSIQGMPVQTDVTPGPDICVSNQEEIGSGTYARFERNKAPWPDKEWGVNVDNFCFYQK
jgi:hypothetical protein